MPGMSLSRAVRTLPWVVAIVATLVSIGLWYWPDPTPSFYSRTPPAAYVAPESKIISKLAPTPTREFIVAYTPNKEETRRIEKKLGGEIPEGTVTNIVEVSPLPYGGKAVTYLVPETYDLETGEALPRATAVKVFPNKAPWFEWNLNERSVGGYYGISNIDEYFKVEFTQPLFRTWKVEWELRASYTDHRGLGFEDEWQAEIGGKVTF